MTSDRKLNCLLDTVLARSMDRYLNPGESTEIGFALVAFMGDGTFRVVSNCDDSASLASVLRHVAADVAIGKVQGNAAVASIRAWLWPRVAALPPPLPLLSLSPPPPDPPPPLELEPPKPAPAPKADDDDAETFGTFVHLDNVLDTLDEYFEALRTLRHRDPDTFALYGRIGGQVMPWRGTLFEGNHLTPRWSQGYERPGLGMMHFASPSITGCDAELITPTFMYFRKLEHKAYVQPTKDDLYEVTLYYRDRRKKPYVTGFGKFNVAVKADGIVHLLRELSIVPQALRRGGVIKHRQWTTPTFLREIAGAQQQANAADAAAGLGLSRRSKGKKAPWTPAQAAAWLFAFTANAVENASDGVQVMASRGGLTARFNVAMLRTPYFFKDRDKTVTEGGRTRRIFHIARTHKRHLANGRETYVRSHFRGERRFNWHGYAINITMPGLHHRPPIEFDLAGTEFGKNDPVPPGWLDAGEVGKRLAKYMGAP